MCGRKSILITKAVDKTLCSEKPHGNGRQRNAAFYLFHVPADGGIMHSFAADSLCTYIYLRKKTDEKQKEKGHEKGTHLTSNVNDSSLHYEGQSRQFQSYVRQDQHR